MNVRTFFDTNILVYAHDTSAGVKYQKAKELVKEAWQSKGESLSIQVLQEFHVTLSRKLKLESEKARDLTHSYSFWKVHQPSVKDALAAIDLHRQTQISFWDAMILQSAKELNCKQIYSEDLNDEQLIGGIKIINPFS